MVAVRRDYPHFNPLKNSIQVMERPTTKEKTLSKILLREFTQNLAQQQQHQKVSIKIQ